MTGHWKRKNKKENVGNLKESLGKEIEMVWACVEKRRGLSREIDGNRSPRERKVEEEWLDTHF